MAILFTKEEAMKDLPFIEDKELYKGVDLALWLYLEKHWSLKNAVSKAAEKYSVKPKIAIERLLRQVIPEEFFLDRMSKAKRSDTKAASKEKAIRSQKMMQMEKEAKNHMIDIASR